MSGASATRASRTSQSAPGSARRSSSITSAPATGCWWTRCATPRSRSTKRPRRCWPKSRRYTSGCRCSSSGPACRRRTMRSPVPGDCGLTCGRRLFGTTRSRRAGPSSTRAGASMIIDAIKSAELDTDVDVRMFALEFSASARRTVHPGGARRPGSRLRGGLRHRHAVRRAGTQHAREETVAAGSQETLSAPRSSATGSVITDAELRCSTRTASWVQTQLTRSPGW